MNTKIIKLDLNKSRLYEKIKAKQGDTESRFLLFQLFDGALPFSLVNRSVRAYMIKPDSKEVFNDLIINDRIKGYCTLELTNQVLAASGTVKIELMITEGTKKLTSSVFELEVDKSINSEKSIVSTNEFTALLNGLASLSEYDNYKNELKDARDGETNVGTNIRKIKSQLEHNTKKIDGLGIIQIKEKYGIIGDGNSHKLSSKFSTLEQARNIYNCCTSLDDEIDWVAIQQCLKDNGSIYLPSGTYLINNPIMVRSGNVINSDGARIIKINGDTRVANGYNEKSTISGFPTKYNNFNVNAVVVLHHNDGEPCNAITINNVTLQGTQTVSNTNDLTTYSKYAIYAPMSSHCNYTNMGLRGCEYAYYTNDSWVTRFSKVYITYCKNGLVHTIRDDVQEHYWTGTSLGVDNIGFSNVNLPINVNHLAYSNIRTVTIDNNVLRSNGVKTKVLKAINSMLNISSVGVEGTQVEDNGDMIYVAITQDERGTNTGLVTINNLDFEAHVYTGNLSNVICCDGATLVLNEPRIVYGDNVYGNAYVIKAVNGAIVKVNNPSRNLLELGKRRLLIDETSTVHPLQNNRVVYGIQPPSGDSWKAGDVCINTSIMNGNYEKFICSGGSSWFGVNQIGYVKLSEHPTSNIYRGYKYWNTTKNKMLVFDGSIWVDYDGNHVP